MIAITDYETAQKWLDEAIKDTEDMDERNNLITLQEVLDTEHELAGMYNNLNEAMNQIEDIARDTRL
jgi:hypothetical protein